MDIKKAFSFIFGDSQFASKILIGAGIWLSAGLTFSLTSAFLLGYGIAITRVVVNDEPAELPLWANLGRIFTDGIIWWIVTIFYLIPGLLLYLIGGTIGNAAKSDAEGIIGIVILLLAMAVLIAGSMFAYAAIGHYAARGKFSYAFRIAEIAALVRNNVGTYLATVFVAGIGFWLIILVGVLACGIGLFAAGPIAMMFNGHIIGQAYVKASAKVNVPATVAGTY